MSDILKSICLELNTCYFYTVIPSFDDKKYDKTDNYIKAYLIYHMKKIINSLIVENNSSKDNQTKIYLENLSKADNYNINSIIQGQDSALIKDSYLHWINEFLSIKKDTLEI